MRCPSVGCADRLHFVHFGTASSPTNTRCASCDVRYFLMGGVVLSEADYRDPGRRAALLRQVSSRYRSAHPG